MHRNRSVDVHQFAMIPKADIPRSSFDAQKTYKTTFDSGYLIPVYVDEMLPGDTFKLKMTAFSRLATPLYPIMDNMVMESFFFFVPNRLVWSNWVKFMGQQDNPNDSISYTVPQTTSPVGGYAACTLGDYLGLPTVGQVAAGKTITHMSLYQRAYNLIWNEWFRDENLQTSVPQLMGDGPDDNTNFSLLRRGKRKDYFTGALPWPQKGAAVTLPLGNTAPVITNNANIKFNNSAATAVNLPMDVGHNGAAFYSSTTVGSNAGNLRFGNETGLIADLSAATAATINQIRQSFQIQRLLERDARGGTRYTEIVRSHFGVVSPDARLQRPEYIGGGSNPININPVAQTSGTGGTGTTTPLGNLAAMGTTLAHGHGFTYSAVEHGMVIGLVSVRADLTYQQGLQRMWSRKTRYDYYFPVFAHLGEQAILNKEIYATGDTTDDGVFGYQERWAEYRYKPSQITGLFRSTTTGTLDAWHLAQKFTSLPTLNDTFIRDNPPVDRILAVPSSTGKQFLFDAFFDVRMARPMPMYSVPGLIDHF
jgi:hypothetical protein